MKIIAKTNNGYMVTLTANEIACIVYNKSSLNSENAREIDKFPEVKISEEYYKFRNYVDSCRDSVQYQTVRKNLTIQ